MGPAEASAESKVGELDVPVGVDQDVVGLDVPMNEAHLVHAVHRAHQLRDVKSKKKNIIRYCLFRLKTDANIPSFWISGQILNLVVLCVQEVVTHVI